MLVRDFFPKLYLISHKPSELIWTEDVNLDEIDFQIAILYSYETELEKAKGSVELMIKIASAFLDDIFNLKKTSPSKIIIFDFIQFQASTLLLSFLSANKIFPYCFDWIANSIADDVLSEPKRDFFPFRIHEFINSQEQIIIKLFDTCFAQWTHDLFYYSRTTGGHNELAKIYLEKYFDYFINKAITLGTYEHIIAMCQLSTWCHNNKIIIKEKILNKCLYDCYENSKDETIKKTIAFQFSVADSNETNFSSKEWSEIFENKYGEGLSPQEKLQITVSKYQNDPILILENFHVICKVVSEYATYSKSNNQLINYHIHRIFSILERTINKLILNQYIAEATSLIGVYFNIPESSLITQPILFIIPNISSGLVYCFSDCKVYVDNNPLTEIPKIVEAENSFLGGTHTFHNKLDFEITIPKRFGVPTKSLAPAYFDLLSNYFCVEDLLYAPQFNNCKGYFLLFGSQLNIQPIISLRTGKTIPIIHSFFNPLPERQIKSVFIWQGYTQMAEIERVGLVKVFSNFSILVNFIECSESTKEEFLANYFNEKYDLFWILGHGEFAQYEYHNSYLDLGNDIQVSPEELKGYKNSFGERRLLIIDTCDGATTALSNSPVSMGIGAGAINSQQSIISHVWPVENLPGLILGILLAIFISKQKTYADSHQSTISLFYSGKQKVLEEIQRYCPETEVVQRIENGELDYQNFYYWGSLNYII